MKSSTVTFTVIAVAAIATLVFWQWSSPTQTAAARSPSAVVGATPAPRQDHRPTILDERKAADRLMIEQLRARGVSDRTLRTIVRALCLERHAAERNRLTTSPHRWSARFYKPSAEQRAALAELDRTIAAEMAEMLGHDLAAGTENPAQPALPGVPEAKRAAVLEIERDYFAARRSAGIGVGSKADAEIERRWREDMAKILAPAELETYVAYQSARAQLLQQRLVGLDLTDAQYETIFRAFDAFTSANRATTDSLEYDSGAVATIARAAGPVAALHFARQSNGSYAELSDVWREAPISPQEEMGRFQTYQNFLSELSNHPLTKRARGELAQRYHALFTRGLTPDQVARFDRTSSGEALQRYIKQINDRD